MGSQPQSINNRIKVGVDPIAPPRHQGNRQTPFATWHPNESHCITQVQGDEPDCPTQLSRHSASPTFQCFSWDIVQLCATTLASLSFWLALICRSIFTRLMPLNNIHFQRGTLLKMTPSALYTEHLKHVGLRTESTSTMPPSDLHLQAQLREL